MQAPIVPKETSISVHQAWEYRIVPIEEQSGSLKIKIDSEKCHPHIIDELEIILGKKVEIDKVDTNEIEQLLNQRFPRNSTGQSKSDKHLDFKVTDEQYLGNLVTEAKYLRSSDIHIEAQRDGGRIRFRVDGMLIDRHHLTKADYPVLINKIKILSNCDISEKRLPQDGRIRYTTNNDAIDIRVSVLPSFYGEKIVMRLLGSNANHLELKNIGLSQSELSKFERAVKKTSGIVLISGPTGSGKSTTLYSVLKRINSERINILTIEDPIEYTLDGITQVQLREEIGLSFSAALRTFLRQDPDVIMLGEIRDGETAEMAIRAAMTGHLVLSTIHTNSAWGTITRLKELGVPQYILASVLNLSVAQRLVRKLCVHCKVQNTLEENSLPKKYEFLKKQRVFESVGCKECHFTGYSGRQAIYEVIEIDESLSTKIKFERDIDESFYDADNKSLKQNAIQVLLNGVTSLDEILPYLLTIN